MKKTFVVTALMGCCTLFSAANAAVATVRMLTQNNYLPGLPVLVRVEAYGPDGKRDRDTWDIDATLTSDQPGVALSTNRITLHNGLGSALVTFTGGGDFNLTATVAGVPATRALRSVAGQPVTKVGGTLSGGSSTWSGIINVTNDLTITSHVLTIQSNTLVLIDGVASGTTAADIFVSANGSIQSLGTELHPVTITCSNTSMTMRWGQIRHNTSLPSLYRHTFIHRAGRAPGEGHTGQAPAIRPNGSTLTFESCSLTDFAETTSGAPGFGTPGKVMFANNSVLTFNDCLLSRARMGPEIQGTSLLFTNSYILETRGPDDSDGIYLHDQQVGQQLKLVDSVIGFGNDDGIDTLGSVVTIENCIIRDWPNPNEDAKGISGFDGSIDVKHCLIVDCWVGVSTKASSSTASATVHINNSTIIGISNSVAATVKANAPGPIIDFRITNSIIGGIDAFKTDFGPTNFTVRYTATAESMPGTGNLTGDPLFKNEAAKNFHLQITSPAIDAGNPASPLDADGTRADMGYFPFLANSDPLIAFGSVWRYLDNGSDQGTSWSQRLFDDSLWSSGPAQLGYSSTQPENDEATLVGFGPDVNNKYITTYFRRTFPVLNPSAFTNVEARIIVDDGAVVYLNGQEIFRPNMGGGPILFNTPAPFSGENSPFTTSFSPALLLEGTNVIAVEVHQQQPASSDLSFDFELVGFSGSVSTVPSVAITSPANGASFAAPANIVINANASDGDGTIVNVQFYQNNALLGQASAAPYSFTWNGVSIGSYALTAVATDNAGNSRTSSPVNITVGGQSTTATNTVVTLGGTWRYLDTGTDQGIAWSQLGFDDSSWGSGPAPLGYPIGGAYGVVTLVSFGPNAGAKYPTTYFRRTFDVANASRVQGLRLGLLRDDGAVVYINGLEVWRTNMPPGAINYLTPASSAANYVFEQSMLPTNVLSALVTGTNVIAVEIHQGSPNSSDIVLDLQLDAVISAATNDNPIVNITAPANNSTFPAPLSTTIMANAVDTDGTVTNVAFYANAVKLADDTSAPFSTPWNSVPAGTYALIAVATDNVGLITTSAVVNVTVSANTAPPVVFSKNPAPGSVTNLTQISVTFSKAVQGVDASDLRVNGVAAANVSGSGSNYTFTFAQPAYGNVAITWASSHGITDVFTPPVAFNTNSAGANWNYTLLDAVPPTITTINPVPSSTVAALTSISITFSEPVTGVNASDLLINSLPASGLSGSGAGPYSFSFAQPALGVVQVGWAGGHGIQDSSGNPFAPAPWSYTLDTNSSGVVISEIMYHPSSENVLEEYIELFNKGATAVNLTGWRFSAGVDFTFPNISIPAGGYVVVAADVATFTSKYPGVANVVGNWIGRLGNDSEDIDLDNAEGDRVDSVEYADEGDWAIRQRDLLDTGHRGWVWSKPHDGGGSSLELINPNLSNNEGQNWAASTTTDGTPGRINSVYQNNIAPLILEGAHFPIIPRSTEQPVISARILDEAAGGISVNLFYRVSAASPPPFTTLAMRDDGLNGDAVANDGLWSARIPAQANNAVIEYYISATDAQARSRNWPAGAIASLDGAGPTGQVVNALFQVDDVFYNPTNTQPLYKLIMTEPERAQLASIPGQSSLQGPNSQMNATFISIDAGGTEFHYNIGVRNRGHGSRGANPPNYRVNFRSDDEWKGLASLNLNIVAVPSQHFGSVISRKSGAVGGATYATQVRVNNGTRITYAAVEVIDQKFADNHFPTDSSGNLYRAIRDFSPAFDYRGPDPASYAMTYFKLNNVSENDWSDIIGMLNVVGANNTIPFTTENVRQVVNVEQWMRHLAVMNLLGNAESGLNSSANDDYSMYRGEIDPRFQLIYWDLDQILGQGSFGPTDSIFSMDGQPAFSRFMHWPDFEPIYYRTLQELLNTTFSQASFDALIDSTLGEYAPIGTINSMKNWMNQRRAYVLSQIPALPNTAAPTATISGTPRSPTPFTGATLTVGGVDVVTYQFSLNGGAYSAETPVATPINLSSLANGTNRVSIVGRGANGVWQAFSNATVRTWVVNTSIPAVRINEVLAQNVAAFNHSGTFPDAIELFNEGGSTVNLGGLRLSDDNDNPNKFTFPANTLLAAGTTLVVFANNADGTPGFHLGFGLDASGDSVNLFNSIANGGALLDSVKFGRQLTDLSIGRIGNSGDWRLTQPTLGSGNVLQTLGSSGSLRINEWLTASLSQSDFVELYNPASLPIALGGLYLTDNPLGWPARNQIEPLNFIGAGEFAAFTADGDGNGRDHLNFSLSLEYGEIGLLSPELTILDCIIYGPQQPEAAQGRCPNGALPYTRLAIPTPGAPNACPFAPPPPVTVSLLTISNVWSYHHRTNLDGVNWTAPAFNDSAWFSGPALLGQYTPTRPQVLPEPIRTVTPTNDGHITFYFRTHFNVPVDATYTALQFRHIIDDGAVFYLNGVEIPNSRFNMPGGPITFATLTSGGSVGDAAYQGFFPVPTSMLVSGDNVFAAEVHQSAANSSDVAFGVELQALIVTNSPAAAGVLINEVLANNATLEEPDGSKPDWVEIYNPSSNAVNLADMSLTDNTTLPRRWVFPSGTILNAQSYLKVRFDPDLPSSTTNTGFGISANGGSVFLFNRIADGGSLLSSITYGLQAADFSIGRVPNGSVNWVLTQPTLGGPNFAVTLGNASLLRVNEWMADPPSGEDDYFEIFNPNLQPVDISRFYLTDDLGARTKHQLPALSFIGVGQDAFQRFAADGNTTLGADHVGFSLRAQGEAVGLTSSNNVAINDISFGLQTTGVSQGRLPDGAATIVSFSTTPTPGRSNFLPLNSVVVNELLAHSDPPFEDAVEFYNPTGDDVDISGWYLSDSQNNLLKYRIPSNTVVRAGGYVVLYEYQFNSDFVTERFSFSSAKGDEVYLSQSTNVGTLTGYRAFATFGASENGVSFGRFRTSVGDDFTAMSAHTFGVDNPPTTNEFRAGTGLTNVYPKVGPVVINEIMYHPAISNDALEFVELRNVTASPVPLYDLANPANTWRLRGGVDFNFPQGTTLPPGGYLVVVSFDPATDPQSLTAFQSTYGTGMTLIGPYSGKLDNSGEAVELRKPDAPQIIPGPDVGLVPYIVADRVVYSDVAPWPTSPDGTGHALKKVTSTLYGNEPLNWQGGAPTPGAANFAAGTNSPPALSAIANRSVHVGYPLSFTASATDPDLPGQTLTFSLVGTPPAGATIGASSGTFNWTPATNQGPANYSISVRVADNGSPSLSATQTFSIAVLSLPRVASVVVSNGMVSIGWQSHPGRRYRVETATTLTNPTWTQVGSDVIASGTTASLTVLGGTDPQRFYRIISFDN
jgi:hypothetical protein